MERAGGKRWFIISFLQCVFNWYKNILTIIYNHFSQFIKQAIIGQTEKSTFKLSHTCLQNVHKFTSITNWKLSTGTSTYPPTHLSPLNTKVTLIKIPVIKCRDQNEATVIKWNSNTLIARKTVVTNKILKKLK